MKNQNAIVICGQSGIGKTYFTKNDPISFLDFQSSYLYDHFADGEIKVKEYKLKNPDEANKLVQTIKRVDKKYDIILLPDDPELRVELSKNDIRFIYAFSDNKTGYSIPNQAEWGIPKTMHLSDCISEMINYFNDMEDSKYLIPVNVWRDMSIDFNGKTISETVDILMRIMTKGHKNLRFKISDDKTKIQLTHSQSAKLRTNNWMAETDGVPGKNN